MLNYNKYYNLFKQRNSEEMQFDINSSYQIGTLIANFLIDFNNQTFDIKYYIMVISNSLIPFLISYFNKNKNMEIEKIKNHDLSIPQIHLYQSNYCQIFKKTFLELLDLKKLNICESKHIKHSDYSQTYEILSSNKNSIHMIYYNKFLHIKVEIDNQFEDFF